MESKDKENKDKSRQMDIAIIGGGVGGCIAALALASEYSVVLIDKNATPPPKVGESLPPAAKRIFHKLNISHIADQGHAASVGMASWWGSEQVQYADHLRNPDGAGWHVDRQLLENTLWAEIASHDINCLRPYSLKSSEKLPDGWRLNLDSKSQDQNQVVNAKIVIDATGRHCTFARQQGATRQQEDKLVSVWMTFETETQNQLAQICPTNSGWWYCAPLPRLPGARENSGDGYARILSYQTDADLLPKEFINRDILWRNACLVEQFADVLTTADLNSVTHHGKVAANSSILSTTVDKSDTDDINWFATGDAAMSFDPLSSQGMFNAMASSMQLSDLLLEKGIDNTNSLARTADEYRQQLARIWLYYQHHKQVYYAQEKRWPDNEFWQRRISN